MSMKVLICDGDWRFAEQASDYLEQRAHLVACHNTAEKALDAARRWQPDLAIVSEELADSGLIEHLCGLGERPAVLLTGWMDRYDRLWRAWQRGGDELLVKPLFSMADLQAGIVTAMENAATGRRPQRQAASA